MQSRTAAHESRSSPATEWRRGRVRGPRRLIVTFYLWFLLALTLTAGGVAGLFGLLSERTWEERLERVVLNQVRLARDLTETLIGHGADWPEIERTLMPLLQQERMALLLAREDGTILRRVAPPGIAPAGPPVAMPAAVQAIRAQGRWIEFGHPLRLAAGLPIRLPGGEPGLFIVSGGRERWAGRSHGRFVAGLAVALGLAWLLCWPLAAHLSRPLRQLALASDALGRGDLGARVTLHRRDEVGLLASSFNRMAENLQRLVASHKQLLADVSHELRSPLARLRLAVELARQDAGPAARNYLDTAERQSEALDALIGELLTHSRLESQPQILLREPLDPRSWIESRVGEQSVLSQSRRVRVEVDAEPGLPTLAADPRLLGRALDNVLRNALAHAPENSEVTIRAEHAGEELRISVRDRGPGVDSAVLERIFEPFFRAPPQPAGGQSRSEGEAGISARSAATALPLSSGRGGAAKGRGVRLPDEDGPGPAYRPADAALSPSGGVGLGLAIARRCIEAHGGRIWAENAEDGPGLVVRMAVPIRDETAGNPSS
jgi:signal transduction histidine kinase